MSGEGRSPKRQRLDSYSPASPPITADPLKHSESSQPQTPPPSVRMSPSWSQPGQMLPGLGMQGHTSPNAATTHSFQSQPLSNGGSSAAEGEQQTQIETPATTVGDAEMRHSGGDTQMTDADNRRTDHERKGGSGGGVLYKVFTEPVLFSQPAPHIDLVSTYSLKNVQQSVARRDPVTGEQTNKLRKSYANKLKDLGLEGRNQATKSNNELWGLVDPAWDVVVESGLNVWQEQHGKLMLDESDVDGIVGMLDSALGGMQQGRMPKKEHEDWKKHLGFDEANQIANGPAKPLPHPAANVPLAQASKTGAPNPAFLAKTGAAAAMRASAPASPHNANGPTIAARPDRTGKKRRYDESSYEGYDDDGYDTGGDSNRRGSGAAGGGKRQKRKDFTSNSPPFSNPTVGVRSS